MSTKVRTISVNLTAGTAKFYSELDAASGKLKDFGREGVASADGTAAAMRALQNDFGGTSQAVLRFIQTVLGAGRAVQGIFTVTGAIAFAAVLVELTAKAYQFWSSVQEAGEKAQGAFRGMAAPIRLTNDELAVSNARLENQIALLSGGHENTAKVALLEAVAAADKLADSLDVDLAKLHKVLDEQNVVAWKTLFTKASTTDIEEEIGGDTGFGGFRARIAQITDEGNAKIRAAAAAKDATASIAAQTALNTRLQKEYNDEIAKFTKLQEDAQVAALPKGVLSLPGVGPIIVSTDQTARLEELAAVQRQLKYEQAGIGLQATHAELERKKGGLGGAEKADPFGNRMAALNAQIDGLRAKLRVVGEDDVAQRIADAFGKAQKAIEEINRGLDKAHQLTGTQQGQIQARELTIANISAEEQWRTKFTAANAAIEDRIEAYDRLTAAIGKGYEATREANIEARVMQEMGERYWEPEELGVAAGLRAGFGRESDAARGPQAAQAVKGLQDQIQLEKALAAAQSQGAEAVRQATLAVKILQMTREHATAEQIQAVKDLSAAGGENTSSAELAKINERIAATERLTAAIGRGAAAVRQAALENKLAEIDRTAPVADRSALKQAATDEDAADHAKQIAEAGRTRLESQENERAKLIEALAVTKDRLGVEIQLRDLENQRLQSLAQESLRLGTLRDGVRAFFIEMQEGAKTAASIIDEALTSVTDKTAANLAKLFTGQRTDWAKAFQQTGDQMLQSSIKSMAQQGLSKLGKEFGVDVGAKPDGTFGNPLWVQIAGGGAGETSGAGPGGLLKNIPGANVAKSGGGILSAIGKAFGFGGGGSAGGESIGSMDTSVATGDAWSGTDFGGFMAGGGDVSPGTAYMVGEDGPEPFVPSQPGTIIPHGSLGGSTSIAYHIDARGADLGAQNRIARGIEASHRAAVATAIQATAEHAKRVPGGK